MRLTLWIAGALVLVRSGGLRELRAARDAALHGTTANVAIRWTFTFED